MWNGFDLVKVQKASVKDPETGTFASGKAVAETAKTSKEHGMAMQYHAQMAKAAPLNTLGKELHTQAAKAHLEARKHFDDANDAATMGDSKAAAASVEKAAVVSQYARGVSMNANAVKSPMPAAGQPKPPGTPMQGVKASGMAPAPDQPNGMKKPGAVQKTGNPNHAANGEFSSSSGGGGSDETRDGRYNPKDISFSSSLAGRGQGGYQAQKTATAMTPTEHGKAASWHNAMAKTNPGNALEMTHAKARDAHLSAMDARLSNSPSATKLSQAARMASTAVQMGW